MKYIIYCDGSCRNNGSANAVGAWGYVVLDTDETIIHCDYDVVQGTTNQRMELHACLEACTYVNALLKPFDAVEIYTDSAYLHNCITNKWYASWLSKNWVNSKKQPVANRDLWELLIPYFNIAEITFHKTAGHAGVQWNEYVDHMVQEASLRGSK